jgi:hypothetical protein
MEFQWRTNHLLECKIKTLFCFDLLVFPLQQALEHNSFLAVERKIEQGNVEYAFKHVDQIIQGQYSSLEPDKESS